MNNILNLLAFSIFSSKGVYAFLLGSGISRNSGIPTGWDIVLDLIKKIAKLENEDCGAHPDVWYRTKYGEEPDYSALLEKLALTPTERLNILKAYFETTEEDDEAHLKQPTKAHKAIAKLVKKGYIKVVITTNFDRLLETALRNDGIEPVVIRHPTDIAGAIPLVHSPFTLIKINGDYLDSRFLNTKAELGGYDTVLSDYLGSVLNDFGMISCGWSGKWDNALIETLRSSTNHRYSSFWTHLGNSSMELEEIANLRKGRTLKITDADDFFVELLERVEALERMDGNDDLSIDIVINRAKKYLSKTEYLIQLHDLLLKENKKLMKLILNRYQPAAHPDYNNLAPILESFVESTLGTLPLLITCTLWSKPEHHGLICDFISRSARPQQMSQWHEESNKLYYFPVLLQFYTIGIIAIKMDNYLLLKRLFEIKASTDFDGSRPKDYLMEIANTSMIDNRLVNQLIGRNYMTPINTFIKEKIKPFLGEQFDTEGDFLDAFDKFEYLLALNFCYLVGNKYGSTWTPYGEFKWRNNRMDEDRGAKGLEKLASSDKENWSPLKVGMFGGSYEKFEEVKKDVTEYLQSFRV